MIFNLNQNGISLEDRLFKNALYIGLTAIAILLVFDSIFSKDYISVAIEGVAGVFFISYYFILKSRPVSEQLRYMFSIILAIIMNIGWISGGGISLLLSSINFLVLGFILMINDSRYYKLIFLIFFVDYALLFVLEYYYHFNLSPNYEPAKPELIKQYLVTLILYIFGGYLIVFLKLNYNKERSDLKEANILLQEKSDEISQQNEELTAAKETLNNVIKKIEHQTNELMSIKGSLEEKVNERTKDLLKLNERLIAQNQQLEQYAYITSHNLKAPVAQIKGLIHLLPVDNGRGKYAKETMDRLHGSVESLEKVFADLTLILKIEKGVQQSWQKVNLITEINNVLESLKNSISSKKIEIILPANKSILIKAVQPYVYSIFHNIVENAVKYADELKGNSQIKIEYSELHEFHMVSITDNGIGIDMDAASGKLFQMYQRFNNSHPGQGFGLFLVKSQMEAMEGKVELESILGHGTTFNLYFAKHGE